MEISKNRRISTRREPKTDKGQAVVDKVLNTATRLMRDQWIDNLSVRSLVKEARVKRQSLLLQIPDIWPEIANRILIAEVMDHFEVRAYSVIDEKKKRPVADRLYDILVTLIDRAETTGRLYANLRSQMFVWGEGNQAVFNCGLQDWLPIIEGMIAESKPSIDEDKLSYLAEGLFNNMLDLASMSSYYTRTFRERRKALRSHIDAIVI